MMKLVIVGCTLLCAVQGLKVVPGTDASATSLSNTVGDSSLLEIGTTVPFEQLTKPGKDKSIYESTVKLKTFQKKYEPFKNYLSDAEAAAVFGYTTGDFTFLNGFARGAKQMVIQKPFPAVKKSAMMPYLEMLDTALTKLPVYGGAPLWRGTQLPDAVLAECVPGGTFSDPAYLSTTKFEKIATGGMAGRSSPHILKIVSWFNAKDVAALSNQPQEGEVLFPRGTKFKVLNVEDTPKQKIKKVITLVEIM